MSRLLGNHHQAVAGEQPEEQHEHQHEFVSHFFTSRPQWAVGEFATVPYKLNRKHAAAENAQP
jgi:hypothetical protein